MQALLEHFITQSTLYSLIAVLLVAFTESLALVGLILPGTVLMAGWARLSAAASSILACPAGGYYRLSDGRLDFVLAGVAL